MKYFHKQRLLKLAKFLREKVDNKRFNLDYFAMKKEGSCGTVACAVGNLPSAFPGYGFKLENSDYFDGITYLNVLDKDGRRNFDVAEHFFGIDYSQAAYLFDPTEYPISHRSRNYVANRIEQFVKRDGKIPN